MSHFWQGKWKVSYIWYREVPCSLIWQFLPIARPLEWAVCRGAGSRRHDHEGVRNPIKKMAHYFHFLHTATGTLTAHTFLRIRMEVRMSCFRYAISIVMTAIITFIPTITTAEVCFSTAKKLNVDAQMIRLKAIDMGWEVGKTTSFTAASLVEGKNTLYPKDDVEVCLREQEDHLQIRVQSKSRDASQAKWRDLIANKKMEN